MLTVQLCLLLVFVAALCFSSSLVSLCLVGRLSPQSGGDPVMQSELQVELRSVEMLGKHDVGLASPRKCKEVSFQSRASFSASGCWGEMLPQ